jgi:hypothetical protein
VAAFFSGGIDSFFTLLERPDITHLIHITGFDVPIDRPERERAVVDSLRDAAARLGKQFVHVRTNAPTALFEVTTLDATYGAALASIALAVSPAFSRIYISSGPPDVSGLPDGSDRRLDHLWSVTNTEIVRFGGHADRIQKLRRVAESEVAASALRVCVDQYTGEYACGRCTKCVRAMVLLEALGARDRFTSLPPVLDLGAAHRLPPASALPALYTPEEFVREMEAHPDRDLVDAFMWLFWEAEEDRRE